MKKIHSLMIIFGSAFLSTTNLQAQNNFKIDSTFAENGIKHIRNGHGNSILNDVQLNTAHQMIAAGSMVNANADLFFIKRNSDGTPDVSFGNNGKLVWNLGNDETVYKIGLQDDGKIVGVGTRQTSAGYQFLVCRVNVDGTPDNSFGNNGFVTQSHIGAIAMWNPILRSVKIQNDGKIVVVGRAYYSNYFRAMVQRYNSDGTIDNSFGTNGTINIMFRSNSHSYGEDIELQADGKILVLGDSYISSYQSHVVRLNSNGTLDASFGSGGGVTLNMPGIIIHYATASKSVKAMSNGGIQVSGNGTVSSVSKIWSARLLSNGQMDNTFGTNGYTHFAIGTSENYIYNTYLHTNNSVSLPIEYKEGNDWKIGIVRLDANGTLDNSFGVNGIVTFPTLVDYGGVTTAGTSDSLYIVGSSYIADNINSYRGFYFKTNPDGTMNTDMGLHSTTFGSSSTIYKNGFTLPSGNVIVVGQNKNSDDDILLTKFDENGNTITSFGNNGSVNINTSSSEKVINAVMTSDYKIIVLSETGSQSLTFAGLGTFSSNRHYTLTGIDTNGQVIIAPKNFDYNANTFPRANTLILDDNEDIIVSGSASEPVNLTLYLTKHNSNNFEKYMSFGNQPDGKIWLGSGTSAVTRISGISTAANNEILMAMNAHQSTICYRHDGTLSTTYTANSTFNWGYTNEPTSNFHLEKAVHGHYHIIEYMGSKIIRLTDLNGVNDNSFNNITFQSSVSYQILPKSDSTFYLLTGDSLNYTLKHYFKNGTLNTSFNETGAFTFKPLESEHAFRGLKYVNDSTFYMFLHIKEGEQAAEVVVCKIASRTPEEEPSNILDAENLLNVSVFPNPFSDKINVRIEGNKTSITDCNIALTDITGKQIPAHTHFIGLQSAVIESSGERLPQGIYLLVIKDRKGNKTTKKIVKTQ